MPTHMEQRCEELTGRQRWHNDHHAYPASARHELAWYEIDLGYYGILLFQELGLTSHVKTASLNPAVEERACLCREMHMELRRARALTGQFHEHIAREWFNVGILVF